MSGGDKVAESRGGIVRILEGAFRDFGEDECGIRAAALAYYTVFALPPLLILLVMIAGRIWSPAEVQRALEGQFAGMMGESGGRQIHQMMVHGQQSAGGGMVATISSIVGLILGATGAFLSLQDALNRVWEVKPDPRQGGIRTFLTKRLLSMGMVLGLGFLLAVSLALTAGISALGGYLGGSIPPAIMHAIDFAVSCAVLIALFAALFKVLPDAEIAWRDVWVGGAVTGVLFVLGKFAIGLYLGRSKPGDAFGAASALAVVLVWAYYAGMILLFGAEFTQEWATARGSGVVPSEGAVRVVEKEAEVGRGARQGP
jgi:membrane protein